jgi:hypothetical protein
LKSTKFPLLKIKGIFLSKFVKKFYILLMKKNKRRII